MNVSAASMAELDSAAVKTGMQSSRFTATSTGFEDKGGRDETSKVSAAREEYGDVEEGCVSVSTSSECESPSSEATTWWLGRQVYRLTVTRPRVSCADLHIPSSLCSPLYRGNFPTNHLSASFASIRGESTVTP